MPAVKAKSNKKRSSKVRRLPTVLHGATDFSSDLSIGGLSDVELIKRFPQFTKGLFAAVDTAKPGGRPRDKGRWSLAYLAYVGSKHADVQPWWRSTSKADWRQFGFAKRPTYERTYFHFRRLEQHTDAFSDVAGQLIQHARRHDPQVGRFIHVDSTEAETNARLLHDCPRSSPCWKKHKLGQPHGRGCRISTSAGIDAVKGERQDEAEKAESELKAELLGDLGTKRTDKAGERIITLSTGCRYKLLDPEAGFRAYTGPRGATKMWAGYYNQKGIDHRTGGPIGVLVFDASQQEYRAYPELLAQVTRHLGDTPEACVFDRGFSVREVFELNTTSGIATVAPWRKPGPGTERKDEDADAYDRHGIPRCRHCGGPSEFVRFHHANPTARLWFRCTMNTETGCSKVQSINCDKDYRLLLPLWRTDELYHALRASHQRYERVHDHWRSRYRVAADENKLRPKRRGRSCQQLRALAAVVLEWLRILWREGWLGSARRNTGEETIDEGAAAVSSLHASRTHLKLTVPYGAAAMRLGIGGDRPGDKPAKPPGTAAQANASP